MPTKTFRQQRRPTLHPCIIPHPPAGEGHFSPEQGTVVVPYVVLHRPHVVLDTIAATLPTTIDDGDDGRIRKVIALLPWTLCYPSS